MTGIGWENFSFGRKPDEAESGTLYCCSSVPYTVASESSPRG